jgi:hypothetical protein
MPSRLGYRTAQASFRFALWQSSVTELDGSLESGFCEDGMRKVGINTR